MSKAQQPTNLLLDGELLRGIERAGLEDLRAAAAGANAILADWASGTGMGPLPGGTPAVEGAGDFEDELGALRQLLRTGTLNLQVRLLDDGAMNGAAVAYALWKLQDRGKMFVSPGDPLYEGIVIGIHSRDNDLTVNALKGKQLTNVRASGTDDAQVLTPPIIMTLEQALEFIDDDELVEVTPESIRIRKKFLTESDRKRASRGAK